MCSRRRLLWNQSANTNRNGGGKGNFFFCVYTCLNYAFQVVNGNANKIAMSRALGAAFLHHQVEQLEKTVSSSGPTSNNWRDRRAQTLANGPSASGRRVPNTPGGKAAQRKKPSDVSPPQATKERTAMNDKEFDRSISSSPTSMRRSAEQDRRTKDADIVVVDGSVLIHALYQLKRWCREGREEVVIVPLEGVSIRHKLSLSGTEISYSLEYVRFIEKRHFGTCTEGSHCFSNSGGTSWDQSPNSSPKRRRLRIMGSDQIRSFGR